MLSSLTDDDESGRLIGCSVGMRGVSHHDDSRFWKIVASKRGNAM